VVKVVWGRLALLCILFGCSEGGNSDIPAPKCARDTCGPSKCGDGVRQAGEECDDGNHIDGDGCESDCRRTCSTDVQCDDGEPCNGAETCSAQRCGAGAPLAEGAPCGDGKFCVRGVCLTASCGDGLKQAGEECDDGNVNPDDGCSNACRFTCASNDPSRNCSANECAGLSCIEATHTCGGTPLPDGASCRGGSGYCTSGVCQTPQCGNRRTEPGEQCDDGNSNDDDGCKRDCTFTCAVDGDCDDASTCTRDTCDKTHACSRSADPATAGQPCNVGSIVGRCEGGFCVPPGCGNAVLDAGEECDNGIQGNGPGSGCTAACRFECHADADCAGGNPCNGNATCVAVSGPSSGGKRCMSGAPLARGAVCESMPRRICDASKNCVLSLCGDGYVDAGAGETCEPPAVGACDASCHTPVCGNGVIEGSEQCDDGNATRLDGCDPDCRYESFFRLNEAQIMEGPAPSFCGRSTNRFGSALTPAAWALVNWEFQQGIDNGTTNILTQTLGLDDLTGVADPHFEFGLATGVPDPARGPWPAGTNPIDWWFLLDASSLDKSELPASRLQNVALSGREYQGGPSVLYMPFYLAGIHATVEILDAFFRGRFDAVPPPDVPSPPPRQLAPGLVVVQSTTLNLLNDGVCGNLTVRSFATIQVPTSAATGFTSCLECPGRSHKYTPCIGDQVTDDCNSTLDLLVGGCMSGVSCAVGVTIVSPTQPDVDNGGVANLRNEGPLNKIPRAQTDGNLNAYSAYFRYRLRRVHATNHYLGSHR
jgi:cysteine-rich repeat protein